jgi:F-type H+-transporting ATPase subunit gamma
VEQLIVMKQRIKTVETIKKVTHAMRLISMSAHTRLLEKRRYLSEYKKTFEDLWVSSYPTLSQNEEEKKGPEGKDLCILVSSQKGLCGTFNTALFKFFEQQTPKVPKSTHIISVGQFANDYLRKHRITPIASYSTSSLAECSSVAHSATELIMKSPTEYRAVEVYSNIEKTFFVQQPQKTAIYPFKEPHEPVSVPYLFEQNRELIKNALKKYLLSASLQSLLFESLLSEQAARFISMDSSTRNADNLINAMKLDYNKLRQAAITRELSELSATLI